VTAFEQERAVDEAARRLNWRATWVGRAYFATRLVLHDLSWRARMTVAAAVLPGRHAQVLRDLKRDGVARIPNYFGDAELAALEADAHAMLEDCATLPGRSFKGESFVERNPGMIRVKNAGPLCPLIARFGRDWYPILINLIFAARFSLPTMVYALTHDGSAPHAFAAGKAEHPFAEHWHCDQWFHQLKAVCVISGVAEENGATVVVRGSSKIDWHQFPAYYRQYLARSLGRDYKKLLNDAAFKKKDFYNLASIGEREEKDGLVFASGSRGDLLLFDSRTFHRAGALKKGIREILWYYF